MARNPINSDEFHNKNCFAYLKQLQSSVKEPLIHCLPILNFLFNMGDYNPTTPYGNHYFELMSYLDKEIDALYIQVPVELHELLDRLILSIYHNDSGILENTQDVINLIDKSSTIAQQFISPQKPINDMHPAKASLLIYRLASVISKDFNPQIQTNIPSIKNYTYKSSTDPIEYRFATQSQRVNGLVKISPLFAKWLEIRSKQCTNPQQIAHIYFNNLSLDTTPTDIPAHKEQQLSKQLHEFELQKQLNIAIITLPASKGLMQANAYQSTSADIPYQQVFDELYAVALGQKHASGYSDFHISQPIQDRLFGRDKEKILGTLLQSSFEALGLKPSEPLSKAQQQAVWMYFIKFELTNFIINTLNPIGYNFTCKDATDRGASSSAFYNLLKSIEQGKTLSREEFERSIDSSAILAKGRSMNFHKQIIWNALDSYINSHYTQLLEDKNASWLILWRDENCPEVCCSHVLSLRLNQMKQTRSTITNTPLNESILNLSTAIESAMQSNIVNHKLLLEVIAQTTALIINPYDTNLKNYKNKAHELKLNHSPALYIIAGIMEIIIGAVLFLPSLGYSRHLINQGHSLFNTGRHPKKTEELVSCIENFQLKA